jgi:hypothetical protein
MSNTLTTSSMRSSGRHSYPSRAELLRLLNSQDLESETTTAAYGPFLITPHLSGLDTTTRQATGVELAADISWSSFVTGVVVDLTGYTANQPSSAGIGDWRTQVANLRGWRGDVTSGEAPFVSPAALTAAQALGSLTERMAIPIGVAMASHMVPLADGGVLCEWTNRHTRVEHFEVVVSPDWIERYDILATAESLDGQIQRVYLEVEGATLFEVLARFSEFLARLLSPA